MAADAGFINALEVSYGTALLSKLNRHVGKDGTAVSVAAPGQAPSYIWLSRSLDDPIVDIAVLYDDEPTPEGYKKVARDLSGGTAAKVFLAYKNAPSTDAGVKPVVALHLLREEEAADAGVALVERALTRAGPAIRLGLQYGSVDSGDTAASAWSDGLKAGDLVDCLGKDRRWRVARVAAVAADGGKLTVSFKGWSAKYDEELPRNSKRLAKPGVHTAGKDTRGVRRQGDAFAVDLEVLASLELRIDDYISGDFPAEERDAFAKGELPAYLEEVLSSKYESEELRDRINAFNHRVMALCVHHLKRFAEPLPPEVRQHLGRLFLDDRHCDYFFQNYGGIRPEAPLAAETNGWAGRLPSGGASRYYVGNLNYFHSLGGYQAILERVNFANAAARAAQEAAAAPALPAAAAAAAPPLAEEDPLAEAVKFAAVLQIPQLCYTADWARAFYQPLRDAVLARVLTLSDAQIKRVTRDAIDALSGAFTRLGINLVKNYPEDTRAILAGPDGACAEDTEVASAIERWSLALSLRLLRCDSLALRVKGVTDIREAVETVDKAATDASGTGGGRDSKPRSWTANGITFFGGGALAPPTPPWFTLPKLLAWLQEHHVLDVVLGGRLPGGGAVCPPHVQTLSRLQPIVEFVGKHAFLQRAREAREARTGEAEAAAAALAAALDEQGQPIEPPLPAALAPAALVAAADEPAVRLEGFAPRHVDLLLRVLEAEWDDDELRRAALEVLAAAAKTMDAAGLAYVYAGLVKVPLSRYDESFVAALKSFTHRALSVAAVTSAARGDDDEGDGAAGDAELAWDAPERHWYGLRQLWEVAAADDAAAATPAGRKVAAAAAAAVLELVTPASRHRQLAALLDRAMAAVQAGVEGGAAAAAAASSSTLAHLKLADALLRAVPLIHAAVPMEHCADRTVARLQARFGLSSLLVRDMLRYKAQAQAEAQRLGLADAAGKPVAPAAAAPGAASADDRIVVGGASHVENVTARLAFYLYVLQQGDLALSFADVAGVWAAFADGALTEDERETFFAWLHSVRFGHTTAAAANTAARLCPLALARRVFLELFCAPARFPVAAAGPQAFRAFEAFFRAANGAADRLSGWDSEEAFAICDHAALEGLDALWDLALLSPSRDVSRDAVRSLIAAHTRLNLHSAATAVAEAAEAATTGGPAVAAPAVTGETGGEADAAEAAPVSEFAVRRAAAALKRGIWGGFVDRCMALIAEATAALGGPGLAVAAAADAAQPAAAAAATRARVRLVAKVLRLLSTFLEAVEATGQLPGEGGGGSNDVRFKQATNTYCFAHEGPAAPGAFGKEVVIKVFMNISNAAALGAAAASMTTLELSVRPHLETLGMLRDRIADAFTVPAATVRIGPVGDRARPFLAARDDDLALAARPFTYGLSGDVMARPAADTEGHVYSDLRARLRRQLRMRYALENRPAAAVDAEIAALEALEAEERAALAAPRRALSERPAYFDALFGLLSVRSAAVVADAWGLVQTLPVNPKVEADVHTLRGRVPAADPAVAASPTAPLAADAAAGALDWDAVFDGSAPLKLLYSLQIAARLLDQVRAARGAPPAPSDDDEEAAVAEVVEKDARGNRVAPKPRAPRAGTLPDTAPEASSLWARSFVAAGGLAHLQRLLLQVDLAPLLAPGAPRLLKECARLLVATWARFAVGRAPAADVAATAAGGAAEASDDATAAAAVPTLRAFGGEPLDRAALVPRLLELLAYATTGAAPGQALAGSGGGDVDDEAAAAEAAAEQQLPAGSPGGLDRKASAGSGGGSKGLSRSISGGSGGGGSARRGGWYSSGLDDDSDSGLRALFSLGEDDEDEWEDSRAGGGAGGDSKAADSSGGGGGARSPESAIAADVLRCLRAVLVGADQPFALGGSAQPDAAASLPPPALHAAAFAALQASPAADATLVYALLAPADAAVRAEVAAGFAALLQLAGAGSALHAHLLAVALGHVDAAYAFPGSCGTFFATLEDLLAPAAAAVEAVGDEAAAGTPVAAVAAAATAAALVAVPGGERPAVRRLADLLHSHPVVEVGSGERDVSDAVLQGLLGTLRALLAGRGAEIKEFAALARTDAGEGGCDLIEDVFERCLFALPNEAADAAATAADAPAATSSVLGGRLPKCKMAASRRAAFDLLGALAAGCGPAAVRLAEKFLPHHDADAAADAAAAEALPSAGTGALARSASVGGGRGGKDDEGDIEAGGIGPSNKYGGISSTDFFKDGGADGGKAAGDGEGGGKDKQQSMSGRSKNLVAARSSTGYVGLRNLGCICYMNATMQQFYMNPDFRAGVLAWAEPSPAGSPDRADSLMYQMQRQFAHLQESEKQYYDPRGLCFSIKDWDGNPTDVGEQKDVPEFLTKLFSDMETQCQGSALAALPKDVFGGQTMQELIADDPRAAPSAAGARKGLYATRDDEFYFLQVRVKNNRDLQAALAEYVAGETVDYKWTLPADKAPAAAAADGEAAGGGAAGGGGVGTAAAAAPAAAATPAKPAEATVKTTRRVSIKGMGDHLMVHLNRFEFDFETMQQKKLNDRFEFPQTLDMWPYTVYGREDSVAAAMEAKRREEEAAAAPGSAAASPAAAPGGSSEEDRAAYVYELVGVVIHMGTAIGGHYYSYIREREPATGPGSHWYEFNDTYVSPWEGSAAAFDRDAFGGREVVTFSGYSHMSYRDGVGTRVTTPGYSSEREKTANAFCLFYDRKKPAAALAAAALVALNPALRMPPAAAAAAAASPASAALVAAPTPAAAAAPPSLFPSDPRRLFVHALQAAHGGGSDRYRAAVRAPVPPDMLARIQAENLEFWRLKTIYEIDYFVCVRELVRASAAIVAAEQAAAPAAGGGGVLVPYPWGGVRTTGEAMLLGGRSMSAVRLAVAFMLNTLTDSNQKATLPLWLAAAKQLLAANAVASAWLLQWLMADAAELRRLLYGEASFAGECTRVIVEQLVATAWETLWASEAAGPPPAIAAAAPATAAAVALQPPTTAFAAPTGGLVRAMVDWMLEQLPRLHREWRRFGAFFSLLNAFAGLGPDARALLLARGLVGRLVDFALCGDGPHPELNDAGTIEAARLGLEPKRDNAGRIVPSALRGMGDNYAEPEFESLFLCLRTLVTSCRTPSGHADSPLAIPPQAPLTAVDEDEVTCRAFFKALAAQLKDTAVARLYAPLLAHLLWRVGPSALTAAEAQDERLRPEHGVRTLLQTAVDVVAAGIRAYEWDDTRPFFRLAGAIMDVAGDGAAPLVPPAPAALQNGEEGAQEGSEEGAQQRQPPQEQPQGDEVVLVSLQEQRVDAVARGILGAIHSQLRFWRSTEMGIELLVKLAKTRPVLRAWMAANVDAWSWCERWYADNERPPAAVLVAPRVDDGGPRMFKRPQAYGYYASSASSGPMRDVSTAPNLRDLAAGRGPLEWDYLEDDDDMAAAVGLRITLTFGNAGGVRAVIREWSAQRGEHLVQFAAPVDVPTGPTVTAGGPLPAVAAGAPALSYTGGHRWLNLLDYKSWRHTIEPSPARAEAMRAASEARRSRMQQLAQQAIPPAAMAALPPPAPAAAAAAARAAAVAGVATADAAEELDEDEAEEEGEALEGDNATAAAAAAAAAATRRARGRIDDDSDDDVGSDIADADGPSSDTEAVAGGEYDEEDDGEVGGGHGDAPHGALEADAPEVGATPAEARALAELEAGLGRLDSGGSTNSSGGYEQLPEDDDEEGPA